MRTVAWIKKELEKFPDDAVCFAYEGEVAGLVIEMPGKRLVNQGVIHCSEGDDEGMETELLESNKLDGVSMPSSFEQNRQPYEQVKPANTAEEMRAEFFRLRSFDQLVRSTMDLADYNGLRGEDRYTILAYHSMKELNMLKSKMLHFYETHPTNPIFIP